MTRAVLILRPQPGAEQTADRARARGLEPVVAPLFTIQPLDWTPPPADRFDAILFTSANAPRHAGIGLSAYRGFPCYAVGEATAAAAAEAGFGDIRTGPSDGAAIVQLMQEDGVRRALHPTGTESTPLPEVGVELEHVPVYSAQGADRLSDVAVAAIHAGAVVLLHSPRAGSLFSEQVGDLRARTRIAAISDATAAAADNGWAGVGVAMEPRDEALLAAADELIAMPAEESARPAPAAIPPIPAAVTADRRRPAWLVPAVAAAAAFLIGLALMAWVLTRWDSAAQALGIVPEPPAIAEDQNRQRRLIGPVVAPNEALIDPSLAQRIAILEQRIGEVGGQTQAAAGNADRAEGLLVAFAARRALDRGVGLGYLEGLLRQRFGESQPQAVETVVAASRQPVTLQLLQERLAEIAPQLTGAGPGQNFLEALQNEIASLIVVRQEGTASTNPRERLRRAMQRLDAGQVEVALAEIARLPGRENARGWIEAAQRYVAARQALDRIEVAALLEPRMPPQQRPVTVPPALQPTP